MNADKHTADDWPDILVIDDEAGQLEEMRDLVASLGYRCHGVQSGEAGIDLLRAQSRIGVVILDLYMPAGPGLDVLKRLRGDPDMPPRIQYLLITGRPLVEDAIEGLDLGAMTLLVKPVSVVSLRRSLTEACRRFLNAHSDAPARTGFRE